MYELGLVANRIRVNGPLEKCRVNTSLGRIGVSFDFAHAHLCIYSSNFAACLARAGYELQTQIEICILLYF